MVEAWGLTGRRSSKPLPGAPVLAERLYPRSYVRGLGRVDMKARAQWLVDWRVIAECFQRLQPEGYTSIEDLTLARSLGTACSDELEYMPAYMRREAKSPSPFALCLVDRCFCASYTRPEFYARLRDFALSQYLPGRGADVFETVGAPRVAAIARTAASQYAMPPARWYDPNSPEYDAFVRLHNIEFPVKHADWRQRISDLDLVLHEPCD